VRTARACAVAVAALLVLSGCASTVGGHLVGQPASPVAPSAPGSGTPSPPPSSPASSAAASALHAKLIAPPKDSVPWGNSWARLTDPTPRQFAAHVYPAAQLADALDALTADGLRIVTHRTWIDVNSTQADVILTQFANDAGAVARFDDVTNDCTGFSDVTTLHFTGGSTGADACAFRVKAVDDLGFIRAKAYAREGNMVMEVFTYSRTRFDQTDTFAWARAQMARLG
jgi:hypothetical protein